MTTDRFRRYFSAPGYASCAEALSLATTPFCKNRVSTSGGPRQSAGRLRPLRCKCVRSNTDSPNEEPWHDIAGRLGLEIFAKISRSGPVGAQVWRGELYTDVH